VPNGPTEVEIHNPDAAKNDLGLAMISSPTVPKISPYVALARALTCILTFWNRVRFPADKDGVTADVTATEPCVAVGAVRVGGKMRRLPRPGCRLRRVNTCDASMNPS
jgi:hypothetical protein